MIHGVEKKSKVSGQDGITISLSDLLEALLDSIPSPTQGVAQQVYADIHEAAKSGSHSGILAYKADINSSDGNGNRPLHIAVTYKKYSAVSFLIDNGANPELKDKLGQSAFHLATVLGNTRMMDLLHKLNANVESANNLEQTPLQSAAHTGNRNVIELLLKYNANIEVPGQSESSIDIAERCHHFDIANTLKLHKASTMTPLYVHSKTSPKKDESSSISKGIGSVVKKVLSGF